MNNNCIINVFLSSWILLCATREINTKYPIFHFSQVICSTQRWRKNKVKLHDFFLKISVFQLLICSTSQSEIFPILYQYYFNKHPVPDYWHILYEDHIFLCTSPVAFRFTTRKAAFPLHSKHLRTPPASSYYPVL